MSKVSESSKSVEQLFDVGPEGPVNRDPLVPRGFRYYPIKKHWRRVGLFHEKLPSRVARCAIAKEIDISESIIKKWEDSFCTEIVGLIGNELEVEKGRPLITQPLIKHGFSYSPKSRTWRRTRSMRNEVSSETISRKLGVSLAILLAWEEAASSFDH